MGMATKYTIPKYPRVMVSAKRHAKLAREARERKLSISALVEKILRERK